MTTQRQLMRANSSALGFENISLVPFLWILLVGALVWIAATTEDLEATSATLEDKVYARIRDKQEARLQLATDLEQRYQSKVYD